MRGAHCWRRLVVGVSVTWEHLESTTVEFIFFTLASNPTVSYLGALYKLTLDEHVGRWGLST